MLKQYPIHQLIDNHVRIAAVGFLFEGVRLLIFCSLLIIASCRPDPIGMSYNADKDGEQREVGARAATLSHGVSIDASLAYCLSIPGYPACLSSLIIRGLDQNVAWDWVIIGTEGKLRRFGRFDAGGQAMINGNINRKCQLLVTDGDRLFEWRFDRNAVIAIARQVASGWIRTDQYLWPINVSMRTGVGARVLVVPTNQLALQNDGVPMRMNRILSSNLSDESSIAIECDKSEAGPGEGNGIEKPIVISWGNLLAGWQPTVLDGVCSRVTVSISSANMFWGVLDVEDVTLKLDGFVGLRPGIQDGGGFCFRVRPDLVGSFIMHGTMGSVETNRLLMNKAEIEGISKRAQDIINGHAQKVRLYIPPGFVFDFGAAPVASPVVGESWLRGDGIDGWKMRWNDSLFPLDNHLEFETDGDYAVLVAELGPLPPCTQSWLIDVPLFDLNKQKFVTAVYHLDGVFPNSDKNGAWVAQDPLLRP